MPLAVDHICDYVTIRVIVFLLVLESSYDSLSVYEWYSVSLWHFASGQKTFTKRVDWTRFTDVVKSGKVGVQLKADTCMLMQKTNYCSYKLFNDCLLHTCAVQESCWIVLRTDYVTNLTPLPWLRQTAFPGISVKATCENMPFASTSVCPLTVLTKVDGVPSSKFEKYPENYNVEQLRW